MDTEKLCRLLENGKFTFHSRCSADGVPFPEDQPLPELHRHVQQELLLVIGGESRIVLHDRSFQLSPGSVVLIDSWLPHSLNYQPNSSPLRHLWFYFTETEAKVRHCTVTETGKCLFTERIKILPQHLFQLFTARWNLLNQNTAEVERNSAFLLQNPLRCLLEEYLLLQDPKEKPLTEKPDLIWSVKQYIESRNARACSLEQLEKTFGYSKFHIAHKFKQTVGVPIGEYINQVRINFAKDAQARGFRNKEIAMELGFSSSATFCKWFKKHAQQKIQS